jgi:hypothetical protein
MIESNRSVVALSGVLAKI